MLAINDEDEASNTALHLAALSGHPKIVNTLIKAGADMEARNCESWTALDCAAAGGWTKAVRCLLDADAPVNPRDKSKPNPLQLASSRGHVDVVNLLIQRGASVGQRVSGETPANSLDLAIDNGHKDVAVAILESDRWKEALRNQYDDPETGLRVTPMRKLVKKMPDVARVAFNRCTAAENNPEHQNFKVTFSYEYLDDMYAKWDVDGSGSQESVIFDEKGKLKSSAKPYVNDSKTLKKNHPLSIMVACNPELLDHPLVKSLVTHKWDACCYMYYFSLTVYCVFLGFLTGYIAVTPAPYSYWPVVQEQQLNASDCLTIRDHYTSEGTPLTQHKLAQAAKYFVMILSFVNIIRELFQVYAARPVWSYFLEIDNYIEWTVYVGSFLVVLDFDKCQRETGFRRDWQWQLAAACIFLAWFNLVLFVRKLPMFGIYIVIFLDVFRTFAKFFFVFFILLIAFALSFNVLISNQLGFHIPSHSLLKTCVMMIGELEYSSIFLDPAKFEYPRGPDYYGSEVFYKFLTYSIFSLFLVIVNILLMNLLIGLAVDDIKTVQEMAKYSRLVMQVNMAVEIESQLPQRIRRGFVIQKKTVLPNKEINIKNNLRRYLLFDTNVAPDAINSAINPEMSELDKMKMTIDKLQERFRNLEAHNERMEAHNERAETQSGRVEGMLRELLQQRKGGDMEK